MKNPTCPTHNISIYQSHKHIYNIVNHKIISSIDGIHISVHR